MICSNDGRSNRVERCRIFARKFLIGVRDNLDCLQKFFSRRWRWSTDLSSKFPIIILNKSKDWVSNLVDIEKQFKFSIRGLQFDYFHLPQIIFIYFNQTTADRIEKNQSRMPCNSIFANVYSRRFWVVDLVYQWWMLLHRKAPSFYRAPETFAREFQESVCAPPYNLSSVRPMSYRAPFYPMGTQPRDRWVKSTLSR